MRGRGASAAGDEPPPPTAAETRSAALRLLGRREYTSKELTTRLTERGHVADHIRTVVATLVAEGWLDDRRVAAAHVRTGSRVKGRGPFRIRRELEARGVSATDAREALDQVSPEDEIEAVRKFLTRKRFNASGASPIEKRRVFQQLLRRGFSAETIARVMRYRADDA